MSETYYTASEVAEKLNVKRITVWDWIRKGKLKANLVGGKLYRISEKQLVEFINKYQKEN